MYQHQKIDIKVVIKSGRLSIKYTRFCVKKGAPYNNSNIKYKTTNLTIIKLKEQQK